MADSRSIPSDASMLVTLDHVLRGTFLRPEALAAGRVDVPVRKLVALGLILGAIYGGCLGGYSLFRGAADAWMQVVASMWKVPLLFVLTLLVTFPSLYVFAALQRLPLGFASTLRLLLLSILVHLTVLASLGPVFAFFAASTTSYPFLLLLNVAFFAGGGLLGFMVLRRATRTMWRQAAEAIDGESGSPRVQASATGQARRVLGVWCFVYGIVGAQMAWLLRPFLGSPDQPFSLFRPREDNVLIVLLRTIGDLFGR